jgi:hypothetical protein
MRSPIGSKEEIAYLFSDSYLTSLMMGGGVLLLSVSMDLTRE